MRESAVRTRQSHLEALRIVSMMMIVVFHCVFKSGFDVPGGGTNGFALDVCWHLGEWGVNVFMLVSGYFLPDMRFRWQKVLRLSAQTMFYLCLCRFALILLGAAGWHTWSLRTYLFPILTAKYWFVTAYALIYLLAPYLKKLVRALTRRELRDLLLVQVFIWSVFPTLTNFHGRFDTEQTPFYNRYVWLLVVFLLGAYIRLYGVPLLTNARRAAYALAALLAGLSVYILAAARVPSLRAAHASVYFWRPNSVVELLLAAALFALFCRWRLGFVPWINRAASCMLGVYLLHDGPLQGFLWKTLFHAARYQERPWLVLYIVAIAVAVLLCGVAADGARQRMASVVLGRFRRFGARFNFRRIDRMETVTSCVKTVWRNGKRFAAAHPDGLLCLLLFTFYACLGMGLSRLQQPPRCDFFFGADSVRVYGDLTQVQGNHYRVKVHPLLLLLLQPVYHLFAGIVHHPRTTAALMGAAAGTALAYCTYRTARILLSDIRLARLLTAVLACGFSHMLFSAVPETFIFAGMFLALFWWFVIAMLRSPSFSFGRRENLLLLFFGVASFGVTLTNFMQYGIGLALLVRAKEARWKNRARRFAALAGGSLMLSAALALVQKAVWKNAPFFVWTYLAPAVRRLWDAPPWFLPARYADKIYHGLAFEETRYMNFQFSAAKAVRWLDGMFHHSFFAGPLSLWPDPKDPLRAVVSFSGSYPAALVCVGVFFLLLGFGLAAYFRGRCERRVGLALLLALMGNMALHFVYGAGETLMYTPHFLFLVVLLFGLGAESLPARVLPFVRGFLAAFVTAELAVNLYAYRALVRFTVSFLHTPPYSITRVFCATAALTLGLAVFLFWLSRRFSRVVSVSFRGGALDRMVGGVTLYGALIFIVCVFLRANGYFR